MDRSFLLETVRHISRHDKYIFADFLLTGCPDIHYWFDCYDEMVLCHTTAPNFGAAEKAIIYHLIGQPLGETTTFVGSIHN